ncbi:MAG: ABC transporter ATP-binding protein [Chlorobia bacterium]|nr:ABC transporter ATP-binding protein [Fimbriimonadaceae bacterium]
MLTASNLGKRYGARWLFRGLEFDLGAGDCLAILGQNGSGKSTLLKTLASLVPPTEGKVTAPGNLGYSALDMAVYPALTAAEHLELTADLRGCEPRVDELLGRVGLQSAKDQQAHEFSTGMKARLKLAIAIQAKPEVLLLDEPGAGLDETGRKLIEEVVAGQLKTGAVILATNDPLERRFATLELEVGK